MNPLGAQRHLQALPVGRLVVDDQDTDSRTHRGQSAPAAATSRKRTCGVAHIPALTAASLPRRQLEDTQAFRPRRSARTHRGQSAPAAAPPAHRVLAPRMRPADE